MSMLRSHCMTLALSFSQILANSAAAGAFTLPPSRASRTPQASSQEAVSSSLEQPAAGTPAQIGRTLQIKSEPSAPVPCSVAHHERQLPGNPLEWTLIDVSGPVEREQYQIDDQEHSQGVIEVPQCGDCRWYIYPDVRPTCGNRKRTIPFTPTLVFRVAYKDVRMHVLALATIVAGVHRLNWGDFDNQDGQTSGMRRKETSTWSLDEPRIDCVDRIFEPYIKSKRIQWSVFRYAQEYTWVRMSDGEEAVTTCGTELLISGHAEASVDLTEYPEIEAPCCTEPFCCGEWLPE